MPNLELQRRAAHSPDNHVPVSFRLSSETDTHESTVVRALHRLATKMCALEDLCLVAKVKKQESISSLSPSQYL